MTTRVNVTSCMTTSDTTFKSHDLQVTWLYHKSLSPGLIQGGSGHWELSCIGHSTLSMWAFSTIEWTRKICWEVRACKVSYISKFGDVHVHVCMYYSCVAFDCKIDLSLRDGLRHWCLNTARSHLSKPQLFKSSHILASQTMIVCCESSLYHLNC